jgi:hypothetical protein
VKAPASFRSDTAKSAVEGSLSREEQQVKQGIQQQAVVSSAALSVETPSSPEGHRRPVADRGVAASSEVPWLRELTRPLSPFTQPDAMMKRNKDLAVRSVFAFA